jgi:hypothetical protein
VKGCGCEGVKDCPWCQGRGWVAIGPASVERCGCEEHEEHGAVDEKGDGAVKAGSTLNTGGPSE